MTICFTLATSTRHSGIFYISRFFMHLLNFKPISIYLNLKVFFSEISRNEFEKPIPDRMICSRKYEKNESVQINKLKDRVFEYSAYGNDRK